LQYGGTYNTSDTTSDGDKPEHALRAAVSTMCGRTECSTDNNEKSRRDQSDLTTETITDETDEDLTDDGACIATLVAALGSCLT
jgi:hypothetical protein